MSEVALLNQKTWSHITIHVGIVLDIFVAHSLVENVAETVNKNKLAKPVALVLYDLMKECITHVCLIQQ